MPTLALEASHGTPETLLIMLPGRGDRMHRFIERDFVAAPEDRSYSVRLADAHWGYYRNRTMTVRLHEDVVLRGREEGYECIWILGISMGGFGSLLYASEFPDNICGVVLLAPYLGEQGLIDEIIDAGGLERWSGRSARAQDYEVQAWRWLRQAVSDPGIEVVLGYGDDDRLADAYGPLVDALAETHVFIVDGGHEWAVWTPLWRTIREAGVFP